MKKAKPVKAGDAKLKGLKMAASYRRAMNGRSRWLAFLFKILLPYEKESKHKGHRPGKENIMNELWYKVRRVISVMLVVALSVTTAPVGAFADDDMAAAAQIPTGVSDSAEPAGSLRH